MAPCFADGLRGIYITVAVEQGYRTTRVPESMAALLPHGETSLSDYCIALRYFTAALGNETPTVVEAADAFYHYYPHWPRVEEED